MQRKPINISRSLAKLLSVYTVSSLCFTGVQAQTAFLNNTYLVPDFSENEDSEFAEFDRNIHPYTSWSDPFNTAIPANVNTPDPDGLSTNLDAVIAQTGTSSAIVAGSGGFYSSEAPLAFTVFDDPAYNVGQVIFQAGTVATQPDPDSAFLYYRETPGGAISSALSYTNIGFLSDNSGAFSAGVTAWEWDLSGLNVAEFYITFNSLGPNMSYRRSVLDTQTGFSAELANAVFLGTNREFGSLGNVTHTLLGGSPQLSYEDGDQVQIQAVANAGWVFVRWAGDTDSTNATETITISGNFTADAIFTPLNYEAWKDNHAISTLARGNPLVTGIATADPNNNGWNNILEYAFGGEIDNGSDATAFPQPGMTPDGDFLTLVYRKQPMATDLSYRIEVSSDTGSTWHYNGDGLGGPYTTEQSASTFNEDGTQTVTVTDLTNLSTLPQNAVRLMRIRVLYTAQN